MTSTITLTTNPDQRGGYGPSLPVEAATERQAACQPRPDPFEKPAVPQAPRPRQDETGEVPPHASPVIISKAGAGGPIASADQSGAILGGANGSGEHPSGEKLVVHPMHIAGLRRRA